MTWDDTFKIVTAMLTSVGGASIIILGLSSWLGKVWANRILEKEKAELDRMTKEHEIRFSQLHLDRAQTIKKLYVELDDLYQAMISLLKYFQGVDEPKMEEKAAKMKQAHQAFISTVYKNKIYFNKNMCDIMERLCFESRDAYTDLTTLPVDPRDPELHSVPGLYRERTKTWEKVREKFKKDITELKEKLEESFRSILGVD